MLQSSLEVMKQKFVSDIKKYMLKKIKYFFETLTIVFFFLIGKIIGLNYQSFIFFNIRTFGPLFKSQKIIDQNIKGFLKCFFRSK